MQDVTVNKFQESFDRFCAAARNRLGPKGCGSASSPPAQIVVYWVHHKKEAGIKTDILTELKDYRPWNEQEARDLAELLRRLSCGEALYTRDNASAHMTASAWVVSPDRAQVLMAYHNIYDSWAWLGGHADGERDLLAVAMREVREESGLAQVRPLLEGIFSLEILTVDGHEKRGAYVSSHLHLNLTYLLEADPAAAIRCKIDENSRVGWFSPEGAVAASTEKWFRERIYKKLNAKLAAFPPAL